MGPEPDTEPVRFINKDLKNDSRHICSTQILEKILEFAMEQGRHFIHLKWVFFDALFPQRYVHGWVGP